MSDGPKSLTLGQLTEALGQDERTIRKWVAAGCPHHKSPGRTGRLTFDRAEVVAWMRQLGRTGQRGRPPAEVSALGAAAAAGPVSPPATPTKSAASAVDAAVAAAGKRAKDADDLSREQLLELSARANLAIKELEVAKRAREEREAEGELVSAAEVAHYAVQAVEAARHGLETLPGKLTPRLVGREYDAIYTAIEEEVRALCEQFASAFASLPGMPPP